MDAYESKDGPLRTFIGVPLTHHPFSAKNQSESFLRAGAATSGNGALPPLGAQGQVKTFLQTAIALN